MKNQKIKKKWWIALFVIIGIIIILLTMRNPEELEDQVVLNDILRLQQMQISSFDPLDAYHAGHIQIVTQLYNTLVDIDLNGKTVPSLAEKWESEDGIKWRFYLRKNVYFIKDPCFTIEHERILNASDVKYTFERLLNKDSTSLGVSYFANISGIENFQQDESKGIDGIKVMG